MPEYISCRHLKVYLNDHFNCTYLWRSMGASAFDTSRSSSICVYSNDNSLETLKHSWIPVNPLPFQTNNQRRSPACLPQSRLHLEHNFTYYNSTHTYRINSINITRSRLAHLSESPPRSKHVSRATHFRIRYSFWPETFVPKNVNPFISRRSCIVNLLSPFFFPSSVRPSHNTYYMRTKNGDGSWRMWETARSPYSTFCSCPLSMVCVCARDKLT